MLRARNAPDPRSCSSRNARTRSSTSSGGFTKPSEAAAVSTMSPSTASCDLGAAMRRRLYLMRHAEVSYFGADGQPAGPLGCLPQRGRRRAGKTWLRGAGRHPARPCRRAGSRVRSRPRPRTTRQRARELAYLSEPAAGFVGDSRPTHSSMSSSTPSGVSSPTRRGSCAASRSESSSIE